MSYLFPLQSASGGSKKESLLLGSTSGGAALARQKICIVAWSIHEVHKKIVAEKVKKKKMRGLANKASAGYV